MMEDADQGIPPNMPILNQEPRRSHVLRLCRQAACCSGLWAVRV